MRRKRNRFVRTSEDVWKILGEEKNKNNLDSRDAVIELLIKKNKKIKEFRF